MTVFTGTLWNTLKDTLDLIIKDDTDGVESKAQFPDYFNVSKMSDNYEDDLELAGPGLASDKPEGTEIALGQIREGTLTRYLARTYAQKLIISEELMEDSKYPESIKAAAMLKRSMWKTADVDAALVLVRAENTAYPGGDGLCLANSAHTIPGGGTFSNTMATPMSPSRAAVIVARANAAQLPGLDGIREGYMLEKVVFPVAQQSVWEGIVKSEYVPESNYNEINVVKNMNLKLVPVLHWTNTDTNYAFITDAQDGLRWKWRRKPRSGTWVENNHEVAMHKVSARWARGWSNPRGLYFVGA